MPTIGLAEKNSYSFRTGMRERACTEDLAATLVMDRKATPLHLASARGHGEVVEVLVAARAKIAPKTASGVTPLHCAAQAGSILAVRGLLRHRHPVDPPIRSRSVDGWLDAGMTPLHAAADRGALEIVQALLDAGADPNRHTKLGYSALFFGARSSNPAVLERRSV